MIGQMRLSERSEAALSATAVPERASLASDSALPA
jgi:hypothetical protein